MPKRALIYENKKNERRWLFRHMPSPLILPSATSSTPGIARGLSVFELGTGFPQTSLISALHQQALTNEAGYEELELTLFGSYVARCMKERKSVDIRLYECVSEDRQRGEPPQDGRSKIRVLCDYTKGPSYTYFTQIFAH